MSFFFLDIPKKTKIDSTQTQTSTTTKLADPVVDFFFWGGGRLDEGTQARVFPKLKTPRI